MSTSLRREFRNEKDNNYELIFYLLLQYIFENFAYSCLRKLYELFLFPNNHSFHDIFRFTDAFPETKYLISGTNVTAPGWLSTYGCDWSLTRKLVGPVTRCTVGRMYIYRNCRASSRVSFGEGALRNCWRLIGDSCRTTRMPATRCGRSVSNMSAMHVLCAGRRQTRQPAPASQQSRVQMEWVRSELYETRCVVRDFEEFWNVVRGGKRASRNKIARPKCIITLDSITLDQAFPKVSSYNIIALLLRFPIFLDPPSAKFQTY